MSDRKMPEGFKPSDLKDEWVTSPSNSGCGWLIGLVNPDNYCQEINCNNCILSGGNPDRITDIENYLSRTLPKDTKMPEKYDLTKVGPVLSLEPVVVEVSNNKVDWVKMVLIAIRSSGPLQFAAFDDNNIALTFWNHCRHIEEAAPDEYMTQEEMLGFLANTQGIVMRYSNQSGEKSDWYVPMTTPDCIPQRYEWATITPTGIIGEPQKFYKKFLKGVSS